MLLQTAARALALTGFGAACAVLAFPATGVRHLPIDQVVAAGVMAGYGGPMIGALAAPRLRRADLARAFLILNAAMAAFLFGATAAGAAALLGLGLGALALAAPPYVGTVRRRIRRAVRLARVTQIADAAPGQAASLRGLVQASSPA